MEFCFQVFVGTLIKHQAKKDNLCDRPNQQVFSWEGNFYSNKITRQYFQGPLFCSEASAVHSPHHSSKTHMACWEEKAWPNNPKDQTANSASNFSFGLMLPGCVQSFLVLKGGLGRKGVLGDGGGWMWCLPWGRVRKTCCPAPEDNF